MLAVNAMRLGLRRDLRHWWRSSEDRTSNASGTVISANINALDMTVRNVQWVEISLGIHWLRNIGPFQSGSFNRAS